MQPLLPIYMQLPQLGSSLLDHRQHASSADRAGPPDHLTAAPLMNVIYNVMLYTFPDNGSAPTQSLCQTCACTSRPRNHVEPPLQLLSCLGNIMQDDCGPDSWLTPVSATPPRLHTCGFYIIIICYQNAIPTEIIEGSIVISVIVPGVLYGMECVTLVSPLMQKNIRVFLQLNSTAFCSLGYKWSELYIFGTFISFQANVDSFYCG